MHNKIAQGTTRSILLRVQTQWTANDSRFVLLRKRDSKQVFESIRSLPLRLEVLDHFCMLPHKLFDHVVHQHAFAADFVFVFLTVRFALPEEPDNQDVRKLIAVTMSA